MTGGLKKKGDIGVGYDKRFGKNRGRNGEDQASSLRALMIASTRKRRGLILRFSMFRAIAQARER